MTQKYGLVCNTIFQGMTISAGDFYDTEEDAKAELLDMNAERVRQGMDEDEDFCVIKIFQTEEGNWIDEYGYRIAIVGGEE